MFVFKVANSRDYRVRGEEGEREKIHEGVEEEFSGCRRSFEMSVMVTALTYVVTGRRAAKSPEGGESGNKKTNGVRIAIPLLDILQTEGQSNDSAKNLNGNVGWSFGRKCQFLNSSFAVSQSALKHKLLSQSHPNETPAVVDQEGIQQLNSNTLPSDQALAATVDTNSVVAIEILPLQFSPTAQQENPDEDFTEDGLVNFGCVGKGERKEKTPGGDRGKKKTIGVGISIPLEDILQPKGTSLKDAAKHLNGSHSTQLACQEYGIHIWPRRNKKNLISRYFPNGTLAVFDQDAILQLNSDRLSSDQALVATVGTNSTVVKEIRPPQFLLTARQENADEDFGVVEFAAVGIGGEGTGGGEMEEVQFNSGCLGKRKRKEKTPGGKRGNKKTTGVRIGVNLEEILQTKGMHLDDAAKHLNVSRSTLKRACREYGIERWPPRKRHELSSQSCSNQSPPVVDQERIPQLNSDTLLPSNQVSATRNTNSVSVKARYGKETIKFRLPWPWGTVELKQQVEKRLELKDGTYFIRYKDEANEMILIACDEDLQDCISSSTAQGTNLIEVFLEPK